jgi:hypothetical protein
VVKTIASEQAARALAKGPDFSEAAVGSPFRHPFRTFSRAQLDVPAFHAMGIGAVFFQNARVATVAPRPRQLLSRHVLPPKIYFYVRTRTADVPFPLADKKYLHEAKVFPGHESTGPVCHIRWGVDTVIGLRPHHLLAVPSAEYHDEGGWLPGLDDARADCALSESGGRTRSSRAMQTVPPSTQLVLVVPSTDTVNPGVLPTQITFSPTSRAHLGTKVPRLIVPLHPRAASDEAKRTIDGLASGRTYKRLRTIFSTWERLSSVDRKRLAFKRWVVQLAQLPTLVNDNRPSAAVGSPFVEEMCVAARVLCLRSQSML